MLQVVAAILRENEKMLICQRSSTDECGMLWEFPGGKVEEGEEKKQAIMREMREELGVEIDVVDVFAETDYFFNGREIHFTFFNARIASGALQLNVHDDARWITCEQLGDFEFMPPDKEVLKILTQK